MLFSIGHGQRIVIDTGAGPAGIAATAQDEVPLDAVVEEASGGPVGLAPAAASGSRFAYYFPQAASIPAGPGVPDALDLLATSMTEADGDPEAQNSKIPALFTYFGQFIDHDITANTDRDSALSQIIGAITPVDRAQVTAGLFNLRDGSLRLDSIYGDTIGQGPFATKLAGLMRHPTITDKMRIAIPAASPGLPPFPVAGDDAADLPRLGFLVDRGDITQAELDALPDDIKEAFLNPDGTPNAERAIIGDARNDENLLVAQLHMSFLRFHNKLADAKGTFAKAREQMRWHYQWLIVNSYLREVCDGTVVDDVINRSAPLYSQFFAANGGNQGSAQMPMPLEFSVAAFRFGHSMVRGAYDHNRIFGEPVPPEVNFLQEAPFNLLFAFTGNGKMDGRGGKLPRNWVIEWERFVTTSASHPKRSARKIDTHLAPPLAEMVNEGNNAPSPEIGALFKSLARRNLRRGYRLSLPTAQACVAALQASHYPYLQLLDYAKLTEGATGAALVEAQLAYDTPLWFYILKEAEQTAGGQHLGPLGSILVADTLVGLVVKDSQSYWHAGAGGGRWRPQDANLPGGDISSPSDMLRFAGMM